MTNVHQMGSLGDMLVHAFERYGKRVAFECDGVSVTYAQLGRDVTHAIGVLSEGGVRPGDRVAQISANCYEMFVVIAAAYIGGFVSVALQYNSDVEEHRFAIDDCEPAILVVDAERLQRAEALAGNCTHPVRFMTHASLMSRGPGEGTKAAPRPIGSFVGHVDSGACARFNYTGGTTGRPKGVMVSSGALCFQALQHIAANAMDSDTRLLVSSPISHGAGSFIPPVLCKGGRVVLHKGFDPAAAIAAVADGRVNVLFLVPTMLYVLLEHPRVGTIGKGQLKRIIYGAAPASPARLREAIGLFGPVLAQSYGQSEAPGTILYLSPEDHVCDDDRRLTAAGKPYPGVQAKLFNDGVEVPYGSGGIGEIWVRAPHVMLGYWKAPELTQQAMKDGWLRTGDVARIDEEGFFHIVDRLKDMVISGGFNIYAFELEQVLDEHPCVKASAIIGVPDARWGEAVKAVVVRNPGAQISEAVLLAYMREKIGPIKTPKTVEFVSELPLTPVGKIDKKKLRLPYWQSQDRAVG